MEFAGMDMDQYSKAFKLDRTRHYYKVEPSPTTSNSKALKSRMSMPCSFLLVITHSHHTDLFVDSGDGDFHLAEAREDLIALNSIEIGTSLFAFKDDSVHVKVHRALSEARVSPIVRGVVSDAVMSEGVRLMKRNLEVYQNWDSKGTARFLDTLLVDVHTQHLFLANERVAES